MFKAIAHQQGVSASEVKERIQSTICIYHKHDCRRTIAAISDALPDMDAAMRPLAEQTIHKLQNITDAAFEEAQFTMTLSDAEKKMTRARQQGLNAAPRVFCAKLFPIVGIVKSQAAS